MHRRRFLFGAIALGVSGAVFYRSATYIKLTCSNDTLFSIFKTANYSPAIGKIWLEARTSRTQRLASFITHLQHGCRDIERTIAASIQRDMDNLNFKSVNGWLLPDTSIMLSAALYQQTWENTVTHAHY